MNTLTIKSRRLGFALLTLGSLAVSTQTISAQQLRVGVLRAEHVVVAQAIGVQPLGDVVLHRFRTIERMKGDAANEFSIAVPKAVADTPRPELDTRPVLMCLRRSQGGSVPAKYLPLYKLTGYRGDRRVLEDDDEGRSLRKVVETLIASEKGVGPDKIADALFEVVREGAGPARLEASESLRGRPIVRDAMTPLDQQRLLVMAAGGVEDSALLCSLAQLAVEADCDKVIQVLCSAVPRCKDLAFARTVGRLAAFRDGEASLPTLVRQLQMTEGTSRDRVLLAIGATKTDGALALLTAELERHGARAPVLDALTAHGSKPAKQLVEKHRPKKGQPDNGGR